MTKIITLDGTLKPAPLKEALTCHELEKPFIELVGGAVKNFEKNRVKCRERKPVGTKEAVVGSTGSGVMPTGDYGLFSTILHCYNNHFALHTTPEDWWYTIIRTVAYAVDKVSKRKEVRNFFVDHEGKKSLVVEVGEGCIPYGVQYEKFFSDMCDQIRDNIKVPGYVDTFCSDFSTSSSTHRIESEITIMSSVQNYFEFVMLGGCGIPEIGMSGTEDDWRKLKEKLKRLQDILKPIELPLYGLSGWWSKVEVICDKLLDTYMGQPDIVWWSNIFHTVEVKESWGPSGMELSTPNIYDRYDGWFITHFLNIVHELTSLEDLPGGLTSVPVTLVNVDGDMKEEDAAFVSGILGMTVDKNPEELSCSVQALHGWALFMEPKEGRDV